MSDPDSPSRRRSVKSEQPTLDRRSAVQPTSTKAVTDMDTNTEDAHSSTSVVKSARGVLSDGTKVWRYTLPASFGSDWNLVVLDSEGMMVVSGDNGRFIYRWGSFGSCFRTFLVTCDEDYVLRKIAPGRYYSGEQTLRVVKEHIAHCVSGGSMKAPSEQRETQLLKEYNDLERREDFAQWVLYTRIPDAHTLAQSESDAGARKFVKGTLPRLQAFLREELAFESLVESAASKQGAVAIRFEQLRWHRDPAASGWRSRCWPNDADATVDGRWELLAYDDGHWEVRGPPQGLAVASGAAEDDDGVTRGISWSRGAGDEAYNHPGHARAKERAFAVFQSLTGPLSSRATP